MASCIDKSFVLKTSTGVGWHFCLSPEQYIVYSQLESGTSGQNFPVDSQPVKDFMVTMDSDNNIHILAHTATNQLVYYHWNGLKWRRQTVEYIRSPAQHIPYFTIMAYHDTVHILYYLKNASKRGAEVLMHYRGNRNKWIGQRVWTFTPDSLTTVENAFIDCMGNLHLLFSQQSGNQFSLLYSCFSPSFSSWANPVMVHRSSYGYSDCYLYADHNQRIHIIWKEKEGTNHIIRYLAVRSGLQAKSSTQDAKIVYCGQSEPIHPTLLLLDGLYCLWKMDDDIYYSSSQDGGNTWSNPQMLPRTSSDVVTLFYYTSFEKPDHPPTLRLWGVNYKEIPDLAAPQVTNKPTTQKKEDQQLVYSKLEKRIALIEQQLENITSSIYALQEQLLQNGKAMYFLEAMIKKLNFQVEQIHIGSRQQTFSINTSHKEKRPASSEQACKTSSSALYSTDDNLTDSTSPPSRSIYPGDNTLSSNKNQPANAQPSEDNQPSNNTYPQYKAQQIPNTSHASTTEDNSHGTDGAQSLNNAQSKEAPHRITVGNVDIIVNPQEDES